MSAGVDVGAVSEFPEDEGVRIDGSRLGVDYDVAVFNTEGTLFAIDDLCTHSLASLADGWVEDGCVECPLHSGAFDLSTGDAVALPAIRPVRTHRVEVVDGRVIVHPGEPRAGD